MRLLALIASILSCLSTKKEYFFFDISPDEQCQTSFKYVLSTSTKWNTFRIDSILLIFFQLSLIRQQETTSGQTLIHFWFDEKLKTKNFARHMSASDGNEREHWTYSLLLRWIVHTIFLVRVIRWTVPIHFAAIFAVEWCRSCVIVHMLTQPVIVTITFATRRTLEATFASVKIHMFLQRILVGRDVTTDVARLWWIQMPTHMDD